MRRKTLTKDLPTAWVVSQGGDDTLVLEDLCRLALFSPIIVEDDVPPGASQRIDATGVVLFDTAASGVPAELAELRRINVALGQRRNERVRWAPIDRSGSAGTGGTSPTWNGRLPTRAEMRRRRELGGLETVPGAVEPDVTIPGQETQLLRLLVELNPGAEEVAAGDNRVILVGAWHGGGGATETAFALARSAGAVLADAAGNHGGWVPTEDSVSWDDLDPADLPSSARLVAALPRQGGVPTLGPDDSAPVRPDQELVASVVAAVPGRAVVDCGTNLEAMNQLAADLERAGKEVSIVVTGSASDHGVSSLAAACANQAVEGPVLYLLRGRKGPLFAPVVQRFGLRWRRLPKPHAQRRWNHLQESLWAA